MEKLSQVVAELEEGAAHNSEEIEWIESPKYFLFTTIFL